MPTVKPLGTAASDPVTSMVPPKMLVARWMPLPLAVAVALSGDPQMAVPGSVAAAAPTGSVRPATVAVTTAVRRQRTADYRHPRPSLSGLCAFVPDCLAVSSPSEQAEQTL